MRVVGVPVPRPGPDQVLVRVHAATVSPVDMEIRSGLTPAGFRFPVGSDVAGDVVLVGAGVTERSPGDRVLVLNGSVGSPRSGGYADYVVVPATDLHPIPDNVSFISSASVGRSFSTAWTALLRDGRLGANERVVVIGAADPVGVAAIQIGRWKGSQVVAVSNGRHAQRLQAVGATRVVSQSAPDLPGHIRTGLGNEGASVVVNVLGAALAVSLEILEAHGRLIFIRGGVPQALDVRRLIELQAQLIGSAAPIDAVDMHHIHKLLSDSTFLPVIDAIYPFSQAGRAHRRAADEANFGAVLLVPDHFYRSADNLTNLFEEA